MTNLIVLGQKNTLEVRSDASQAQGPVAAVTVRKGQGSVQLTREEFRERLRLRFYDPAFDTLGDEIDTLTEAAWNGYHEYRKTPRTKRAGSGFFDPNYELPIEWLKARAAIHSAERTQRQRTARSRVLLICGAARHDKTCPGEMSKTFRRVTIAQRATG